MLIVGCSDGKIRLLDGQLRSNTIERTFEAYAVRSPPHSSPPPPALHLLLLMLVCTKTPFSWFLPTLPRVKLLLPLLLLLLLLLLPPLLLDDDDDDKQGVVVVVVLVVITTGFHLFHVYPW